MKNMMLATGAIAALTAMPAAATAEVTQATLTARTNTSSLLVPVAGQYQPTTVGTSRLIIQGGAATGIQVWCAERGNPAVFGTPVFYDRVTGTGDGLSAGIRGRLAGLLADADARVASAENPAMEAAATQLAVWRALGQADMTPAAYRYTPEANQALEARVRALETRTLTLTDTLAASPASTGQVCANGSAGVQVTGTPAPWSRSRAPDPSRDARSWSSTRPASGR